MAKLIAQNIQIWDGTSWNDNFNIFDGTNFQNINSGKVNIRGTDGNWYRKGNAVPIATIYPSPIALSRFHIDITDTNWVNASISSNGNYNPSPSVYSTYSGSDYTIFRGIIRFDFSTITPISFSSAKLILKRDTGSINNFNMPARAYRLANDGIISGSDFGNFTTNYSDIRGVVNDVDTITIELNASASIDLNSAINGGNIFTFMIRDYHDAENIPPTTNTINGEYSYTSSRLELYN